MAVTNLKLTSSEPDAPVEGAESGWRLKLVVFVSGAVLMGLEMTGSRVLATHFGSSIYVWGSIIGVFLAALATGYYWGGMLADRHPKFSLLNILLLAAGCWLLVIPFYANRLCREVRYVNLGERLGPLVATTLLFVGPSILMGMVSPFAVRLAARAVEQMGNISGKLYALSTLGSIVGTLVTAFWLIPAFGARTLLQVLGLCLIVLPPLVLRRPRPRLALAVAFVLIVPASLFLSSGTVTPTRPGQKVVYEADSAYHYILVLDDEQLGARALQFNNHVESRIDLKPPHETRASYTNAFHLAQIFKPDLRRILIIGGGGGIGARKFVNDYSDVTVDLVEIDPLVAEVGFKYFYLERGPRLRVHVEDGRNFVRRANERYDLVILDAYTIGGQIPFHLTTREFMHEVRNLLEPDGVLLANITSALEGRSSRILRAEYKTLASVFDNLYLFPLPHDAERNEESALDPTRIRNVILIATNGPQEWTTEAVVRAAEELERGGRVRTPTFIDDARRFTTVPPPTTDVPLLTDDYAPVDTMVF